MATYKGIGYDTTNAKNRTGTSSDIIEFDAQVNADDGLTVTGALSSTTLNVTGDASIGGDLDVAGDIISRGAVNLVVEDNFIDLNFGNTTNTSESGGVTVSMNRTTGFTSGTITTFVAGVNGVSNPTFVNTDATGSSLLAVADIVMITGATQQGNNGLYQVTGVSAASFPQTVTIAGTGTTAVDGSLPFCQTQFEAETGATASSSKIDLAVWAVADGTNNFLNAAGGNYAKGTFVTAYATSAVLSDFDGNGDYTTASSTLQSAYDGGQDITTTNAKGPIALTFDTNSSGMTMNGDAAGVGSVTLGATNTINTFTVDAAAAISLDAAASSNVNVAGAGATLTLGTSGGGVNRTIINSAGTGTNAITLNASAGGFDIDGTTAASAITSTEANLTVSTATSGALALTSAGTNTMTSASGSALTLNDGVATFVMTSGSITETSLVDTTLTGSGTMTLTGGGVSKFGDDTGTWDFDGSGNLTETGMVAVTITPSAAMTLTAGAASTWSTGAGALTITSAAACTWSTGAGLLSITGAGGITQTSTGGAYTVTATGQNVTIDGAALSIDGTASSNISVTGADLTLSTITSGSFRVTAVGAYITTSTTYDIDSSGAFTLDAATVTIGGDTDTGDIAILSGTGDVELSSDNAAKEVRLVSNYPKMVRGINAGAAGVTAGDCLYGDIVGGALRVSSTDADAVATSQFIGIAANTAAAGNLCNVVVVGIVKEVTGDGAFVAANNLGKKVYLSTTAGKISLTPPTGLGDVIFQVGICMGGSGTAWEVLLQPQFIMELG